MPQADGWTDLIDPPTGAGNQHHWVRPASNSRQELSLYWQCQRCGARIDAQSSHGMLSTSYRSQPDTPECREGFSDVPEVHVHVSGELCGPGCERGDALTLHDLARGAGWVNCSGRFDETSHIYALGDHILSRAEAQEFGPGLWEWQLADEDEPELPGHVHEWIWEPPTGAQELDYGECACGLLVRRESPSVPGRARRQFAWSSDAKERT